MDIDHVNKDIPQLLGASWSMLLFCKGFTYLLFSQQLLPWAWDVLNDFIPDQKSWADLSLCQGLDASHSKLCSATIAAFCSMHCAMQALFLRKGFFSIYSVPFLWMLWLDAAGDSTNTRIFLGYLLCTNLPTGKTEGSWEWLIRRIVPQVLLEIN